MSRRAVAELFCSRVRKFCDLFGRIVAELFYSRVKMHCKKTCFEK